MKLTPKKSLGQNFLRSKKALNDIVESLSDTSLPILEIGGGEGVLTKKLLEKGFLVTVVEIDSKAVEKISSGLRLYIENGKLKIIHKDILKTSLDEIFKNQRFNLVGNIPYYITGLILRHIFNGENLPRQATLMVQKEVANRIIAGDKKESLLSLSVKFYGNPKLVSIVKRGSFFPVPNVDSAIITIENIKEKSEIKSIEKNFFDLIHASFAHKRKFALSNIKKYLKNEKLLQQVEKFFEDNNLYKVRGEDLKLEQWLKTLK